VNDDEIRDAATVLVARDGPDGVEVLMVRRTAKAAFAAGAYVFPGGAVDSSDRTVAESGRVCGRDVDPEDLAFWVTALRETFEEAGILAGASVAADPLELERQRDALNCGDAAFSDVLDTFDAVVDVARIPYISRWVTPKGETRRFDTRFFLVDAPGGQEAAHDENETTASEWVLPREALRRSAAGEIFMLPPTIANLTWLAEQATVAAAVEAGLAKRVDVERPEVVLRDDGALVLRLSDRDLVLKPPPEAGEP